MPAARTTKERCEQTADEHRLNSAENYQSLVHAKPADKEATREKGTGLCAHGPVFTPSVPAALHTIVYTVRCTIGEKGKQAYIESKPSPVAARGISAWACTARTGLPPG